MSENLPAEYGCIYKWKNTESGSESYCVVISSNTHAMNNIVSILFLRPYVGSGDDVVAINVNNTKYCVRADFVTYTQRVFLVQKMGTVSKDAMKRINTRVASTLNLIDRKDLVYESLYNDLLDKLVSSSEVVL